MNALEKIMHVSEYAVQIIHMPRDTPEEELAVVKKHYHKTGWDCVGSCADTTMIDGIDVNTTSLKFTK